MITAPKIITSHGQFSTTWAMPPARVFVSERPWPGIGNVVSLPEGPYQYNILDEAADWYDAGFFKSWSLTYLANEPNNLVIRGNIEQHNPHLFDRSNKTIALSYQLGVDDPPIITLNLPGFSIEQTYWYSFDAQLVIAGRLEGTAVIPTS